MLVRNHEQWPPDYVAHLAWRQKQIVTIRSDKKLLLGAIEFYKTRPIEFIEHWADTFDPRNSGTEKLTKVPFIPFQRQREMIEFLKACLERQTNGLVEKSRDLGASWVCVSFAVWMFLFLPGASIGFGSRKAASVDRIGDLSSLFEKIRFQLLSIPRDFWPQGFGYDNMSFMKITSPETNSSIAGESGDDLGRGARTSLYFVDESAHLEHQELAEAALSDTTRVRIDISSVNGLGNVFHRKREAGIEWIPGTQALKGKTNVFVMDWSDHPEKTKAWYDERKSSAISSGLLHVFAQEIDRNYAASVEGVVIPPEWVKSAIDAHLKIPNMDNGPHMGALDVADGGGDRNALAVRKGSILRELTEWGERDTGVTARRAIAGVEACTPILVQYDSIGVGSGVKAETNRLKDDRLMPKGIDFISWDAGGKVQDPDEHVEPDDKETPINKDFYRNLKAQGWWQLRRRFEKTHRALTEGLQFSTDEMISIDSRIPLLRTLQKELSQPTAIKDTRMRLVIDKMPEGTHSPNLADAVMMCYWPIETSSYLEDLSWVG